MADAVVTKSCKNPAEAGFFYVRDKPEYLIRI